VQKTPGAEQISISGKCSGRRPWRALLIFAAIAASVAQA
jgi:hypothetical protein